MTSRRINVIFDKKKTGRTDADRSGGNAAGELLRFSLRAARAQGFVLKHTGLRMF